MKMSEKEHIEKRKFLFRFLKEKGLYSAYVKYIHNQKTYNQYQIDHPDWSFDNCAKEKGVYRLISCLIFWQNTKEGHAFWNDVHENFKEIYEKRFS